MRITIDHKDRHWTATVEHPVNNWVLLDVRNNEVYEAEFNGRFTNNPRFKDLNLLVKTFTDNSGYVVETFPKDYRSLDNLDIENQMIRLAEFVGECKLFEDGIIWEHLL